MESQSLPRCTGGVGGMGNLTLRPERDRLSEIRLETTLGALRMRGTANRLTLAVSPR